MNDRNDLGAPSLAGVGTEQIDPRQARSTGQDTTRPWPLRAPCACGSSEGLATLKSGQLVVSCAACRRFQYNAPRLEQLTREAPPGEWPLAVLARPPFGQGDNDEELRVTLATFKEHRYVALSLFFRGREGWRPCPAKAKGVSIRGRELRAVAAALVAAAEEIAPETATTGGAS